MVHWFDDNNFASKLEENAETYEPVTFEEIGEQNKPSARFARLDDIF